MGYTAKRTGYLIEVGGTEHMNGRQNVSGPRHVVAGWSSSVVEGISDLASEDPITVVATPIVQDLVRKQVLHIAGGG